MIIWYPSPVPVRTPSLVDALLKGSAVHLGGLHPSEEETSGLHRSLLVQHAGDIGVGAVLLTSIPFGLAAGLSFVVAHRSQKSGEKILHIAVPWISAGLIVSWFPLVVGQSVLAGFVVLTIGIIGVHASSAPLVRHRLACVVCMCVCVRGGERVGGWGWGMGGVGCLFVCM